MERADPKKAASDLAASPLLGLHALSISLAAVALTAAAVLLSPNADAKPRGKVVAEKKFYAGYALSPYRRYGRRTHVGRHWRRRHHVGGHTGRPVYKPYLYWNGPYGFHPRFDNRSFFERVISGPYVGKGGGFHATFQ